jgi:hypothetical protein
MATEIPRESALGLAIPADSALAAAPDWMMATPAWHQQSRQKAAVE